MLNVVALQGRLTADPELKYTQNNHAVCAFRIAVDRNFADQDGKRQADYINIIAWRQTAEFVCKYFSKGQMIALNGSIQTRNYEDRNGNKRVAVEVVAGNVNFCGPKKEEGPGQAHSGSGSSSSSNENTSPTPLPGFLSGLDPLEMSEGDDLPF